MSELKWRTKEGQLIPIPEIGDRHLLNIYRMLDRKACKIRAATRAYLHPVLGPHGDMAQLAASQEMDKLWDTEIRIGHWLNWLGEEIIERKLELPVRINPRPLPRFELVESTSMGNIHRIIMEGR